MRFARSEAAGADAVKLPVDIAQHAPGLGHRDRVIRLLIAIENVIAGAANQDVAPRAAHQEVGGVAADHQVVAVAAADQFAAPVLGDGARVVAHGDRRGDALRDIAVEQVVTGAAIDQVAADIARGEAVGPPFDAVRASAGADPVASRAALNAIVATVGGVDCVVAAGGEDQVIVWAVLEIVAPARCGHIGIAHRIAVAVVDRLPLLVQRVLQVAEEGTRDRAFDRRIAVNQANPEVAVTPVLEGDGAGPYAAVGLDEADHQIVVAGEIALPVLCRYLGKDGAPVETVPAVGNSGVLEECTGDEQGTLLFGSALTQAAGERGVAFGDPDHALAVGVPDGVVAVAGFAAQQAFEEAVLVDVDAGAAFFVVVAAAAFEVVRAAPAV